LCFEPAEENSKNMIRSNKHETMFYVLKTFSKPVETQQWFMSLVHIKVNFDFPIVTPLFLRT